MHVGQAGHRGRDARVDDDELAAALLLLHHVAETVGLRPCRVERPHQAAGRGVGRIGTHGQLASHQLRADPRGRRAGGAFRAVRGRAEQRGQALHSAARLLRIAAVEQHRFGTALFFDAVELAGDARVRVVPGDGLPFGRTRALRVRAHHGIRDAMRIVQLLQAGNALRANGVGRVLVARLHAHHLAVLHRRGDAALRHVVAHVAVRILHLDGRLLGDGALGMHDLEGPSGQRGACHRRRALEQRAARNVDGLVHVRPQPFPAWTMPARWTAARPTAYRPSDGSRTTSRPRAAPPRRRR